MKADEKTAGEVVEAMTSLLGAYEAHNLEQVMDLYAPDPDATALGTNLDQFLTGQWKVIQFHLSFPSDESGIEIPVSRL